MAKSHNVTIIKLGLGPSAESRAPNYFNIALNFVSPKYYPGIVTHEYKGDITFSR